MPPKNPAKTTKPSKTAKMATPTRRSERLASRESSAEPPVQIRNPAVIVGLATESNSLIDRYQVLKDNNDEKSMRIKELEDTIERSKPSFRRAQFMKKLDEQFPVSQPEKSAASPVAAAAAEADLTAGPVAIVHSTPTASGPASPPQPITAAPERPAAAENTAARPPQESPWKNIVDNLTGYIPGFRKRRVEPEATVEEPSAKRTRVSEAESTPISRPTPQKHLMRSVKNPAEPTSLSTITEYTEPSSFMDDAPPITPSRKRSPPFALPRNLPQSTPVLPKRRTIEEVRAKAAQKLSNTPLRLFSWEKQAAMQKPREKNADTRLAKMQEYTKAKADYERLKEDEDVKNMLAHSVLHRKRMKIDDLAIIPHNRPGDSSSTFRVPEGDSDSEISVDEDFEEKANAFEMVTEARDGPETDTAAAYSFPNVGTKPSNYHVTYEYQQEAGALFAKGLAGFLAA